MVLRNGIYRVVYVNRNMINAAASAEALAVLREGQIFGSDQNGAVFTGHVGARTDEGTEVCLSVAVPPFGKTAVGFVAGPVGARFAIDARLCGGPMPETACLRIAGATFPITLCYVGPLLN